MPSPKVLLNKKDCISENVELTDNSGYGSSVNLKYVVNKTGNKNVLIYSSVIIQNDSNYQVTIIIQFINKIIIIF